MLTKTFNGLRIPSGVPETVQMMPAASTLQTQKSLRSVAYRFPSASKANPPSQPSLA